MFRMAHLLYVWLALALLAAPASAKKNKWKKGYATRYNDANGRSDFSYQHCPANGFGALKSYNSDSVALGWKMLKNWGCGSCIQIKCDPSRPLYGNKNFCKDKKKVLWVTATNACPECNVQPTNCQGCSGKHIDMWSDAFDKLIAGGGGLMNIKYRRCPNSRKGK